ncbi:MAG: hypothetical protein R2681_07880 [Pyrinomonadaceae bacterium]
MPDFVSRRKLKKKAISIWENEGGKPISDTRRKQTEEPPKKRKVRKSKVRSTV